MQLETMRFNVVTTATFIRSYRPSSSISEVGWTKPLRGDLWTRWTLYQSNWVTSVTPFPEGLRV